MTPLAVRFRFGIHGEALLLGHTVRDEVVRHE